MKKNWYAVLIITTVACFVLALTETPLSPVGYFGFYLGAITSGVIWYFDYGSRIHGIGKRTEIDYLFIPEEGFVHK